MIRVENMTPEKIDRAITHYYKNYGNQYNINNLITEISIPFNISSLLKKNMADELIKKTNLVKIEPPSSNGLSTQLLEGTINQDSPIATRQDKAAIINSIRIDIRSIDYARFFDNEIIEIAIEEAQRQGYILSSYNSPGFLRTNLTIIKQSLQADNQSSKYICWSALSEEEKAELENYIIENNIIIVITFDCPNTFKRNTRYCINSAFLDSSSPVHFDWQFFSEEEKETIIKALVKHKFIINSDCPLELLDNIELCLVAIEKDISNIKFFSNRIRYYIDKPNIYVDGEEQQVLSKIKSILLANDYYSLEQMKQFCCLEFTNRDFLETYLRYRNVDDNEKRNVISAYINDALSYPVKVTDVKKVYHYVASKKWEEYRLKNNDYYTNIFNRVCDAIENNASLFNVLEELRFLQIAEGVLEEKKYLLFNAFIEYHQLYHSPDTDNKAEMLKQQRDKISEIAALFISKSKENFIGHQMELFDAQCKKLFMLRTDNPVVKKRVIEVKQRDMLKKKYNNQDENLLAQLKEIKNRFASDINPSLIDLFISKIINENSSNIDTIFPEEKPERFEEYELYEKISRVINRLNSNSITIDSPDADKYKSFISYSGSRYIYNGQGFNVEEVKRINEYKNKKFIFNKIKSEIMKIAKSIDSFDNLTDDDIKSVIEECPFTDEYYTFNFEIFRRFNIRLFEEDIASIENTNAINTNNYNDLIKIILTSGLFHILLLYILDHDNKEQIHDMQKYIYPDILSEIIEHFSLIENYQSSNSIDNILDLAKIFQYGDMKQINILGRDLITKIYNNNGFTSASQATRMDVACDLVSAMRARNSATVPYINGQYHNYRYSMYDSTDVSLLSSGLDTNACFRVCGNDNDFLHYCALDKNGFVIKLTDNDGNFIGRASGFRNGNGVYINQLRTIYDKKANAYKSEKEAISQTFMQACHDIVETSQNNPDETNKIDFVVVTKSYSLECMESNVDRMTKEAIGCYPMDTNSEDWIKFTSSTDNLRESQGFTTDYRARYSLICVASAIGELTPDKIKKGDVPALYKRTRKKINCTTSNNLEEYINQIKAIYSHQTNQEFNYIRVPQNSTVFYGDNWFIIIDDLNNINGCYIINDVLAQKEYEETLNKVKQQIQVEIANSKEFDEMFAPEEPTLEPETPAMKK